MSRRTNTTNPKYLKMQKDFATRTAEFGKRNPYLLSLIIRAKNTKPLGDRRFGYLEAFSMMAMFDETGYTDLLIHEEDIQSPKIFWDLMDCAKKRQRESGDCRSVRALIFFYENLDKKGTLSNAFKSAEKTPYPYLRRNSFVRQMCHEYTCSGDVFIMRYRLDGIPALLILPYRNHALRDIVLQAYIHDQTVYTNDKVDLWSLCSMEDTFGPYIDSIMGPKDLNAEVLTYAIDHIMHKYADNERLRIKSMVQLWSIFRYVIMTNRDRDFFQTRIFGMQYS